MRKNNLVNYPVGVRSRNIENVNGLSMHILESGYDELNKPFNFAAPWLSRISL